jgi:hypothetical protein
MKAEEDWAADPVGAHQSHATHDPANPGIAGAVVAPAEHPGHQVGTQSCSQQTIRGLTTGPTTRQVCDGGRRSFSGLQVDPTGRR